jgi:diguanylate cyclase (GGDEF)-like protein
MIDLDDFKQVNDELGHDAGDHVLARTAEALSLGLGPADVLARTGGDEFLILLLGRSRDDAEDALARLAEHAPAPWTAGVHERRPGETLDACMSRASTALRADKHAPSRVATVSLTSLGTSGVAGSAHARRGLALDR